MRTGLGAVALKLPLKAGLVMASTYRFTRSSLNIACLVSMAMQAHVLRLILTFETGRSLQSGCPTYDMLKHTHGQVCVQ